MGLRFRKSVNFGPFRVTASKSGISTSVGVKGYRVTKTARGSVRKTASIPGTGISYVTEAKTERGAEMRKEKTDRAKKPLFKRWWFWLLLALVLIGALGSGGENNTAALVSPSPAAITREAPQKPSPTPVGGGVLDVPTATLKPTATPAPTPEPTPKPVPEYDYVLNNNSMKFHEPSCSSVKKISDKNRADYHGTRDSVLAMGYEPCGQCKP